MTQVKHTIQKLTVDVQTSSVSLGHEIRENARLFIDEHVIPLIESHLSKIQSELSEQEIIQLDRLTVDISTSPGQWNGSVTTLELQTALDKSLEETVKEIQSQRTMQLKADAAKTSTQKPELTSAVEGVKIKDKTDHLLDVWLNILESGVGSLNLYVQSAKSPSEQEEELLNSLDALSQEKLVQLSKRISPKAVQERLINQYSQGFLVRLLEIVFQRSNSPISKIDKNAGSPLVWSKHLPDTLRRSFLLKILEFIPFDKKAIPVDSKVGSTLFEWLITSPVTKSVLDIGKKEWPVLLKHLSIPEKGKLSSRIQENKLSNREEQFVELAIRTILTVEWLHNLTGKQESLSNYGTYLTTLLEPVILNDAQELSQNTALNSEEKTSVLLEQTRDEAEEVSTSNTETMASLDEQNEFIKEETDSGNDEIPSVNNLLESENKPEQLKQDNLSDQHSSENTLEQNQNEETIRKNDSEEIAEKRIVSSSDESILSKQLSDNNDNNTPQYEQKHLAGITSKQKSLKDLQSPTIHKLQEESSFVWVQNAGVILTHPFLKHLFSRTGILNEANELTDPVLAAHILHFVATGNECDFEYEMVLEKLLCGLAPEDSIPREVPISPAIRAEIDGFFEAIKSNWKPLSTSSDEAMRETFFRREGKLLMDESGLRLVVERKTVDILLNQLSWPISIIRLPWLKDILYVEW